MSVAHNRELRKTAEPIEMPFGVWTRVGPRNHVLSGGPDPPKEGAIFWGSGGYDASFRQYSLTACYSTIIDHNMININCILLLLNDIVFNKACSLLFFACFAFSAPPYSRVLNI